MCNHVESTLSTSNIIIMIFYKSRLRMENIHMSINRVSQIKTVYLTLSFKTNHVVSSFDPRKQVFRVTIR